MKRIVIFLLVFTGLSALVLSQRQGGLSSLKVIQLQKPKLKGSISLEETLAKRRSIRNFTEQKLDYVQIGQLAWAAQGVTEPAAGFRTAPSAGAIYPMQLYFATDEGLFVYQPRGHTLRQLTDRDIRQELAGAALNQSWVAEAACDIIIAGSVKKISARYGRKARAFTLLEAGHIAQNIHLQAVSLGLGSVPVGAFEVNTVRRLCRTLLEPFYIIPVGYPKIPGIEIEQQEQLEVSQMQNSDVKKAVLIVASVRFRDEELFETKDALKQAKIQTVIASSRKGSVRGMLGGKAEATILIEQIDVNDYDAVVFIGGIGAKEYFDNQTALDIARQAKAKNKVLAAICIAPAVLANAGLLDGVRVTSYESERVRLKKAGADFTGANVEQDGLIITGSGPKAAGEFGQAIVQALQKQ
ncbi:MAG: DJ-1/PfpI family protein [Phycisphaerales bacterium]|jgi:SagB-type dehydrogenase family enzyme